MSLSVRPSPKRRQWTCEIEEKVDGSLSADCRRHSLPIGRDGCGPLVELYKYELKKHGVDPDELMVMPSDPVEAFLTISQKIRSFDDRIHKALQELFETNEADASLTQRIKQLRQALELAVRQKLDQATVVAKRAELRVLEAEQKALGRGPLGALLDKLTQKQAHWIQEKYSSRHFKQTVADQKGKDEPKAKQALELVRSYVAADREVRRLWDANLLRRLQPSLRAMEWLGRHAEQAPLGVSLQFRNLTEMRAAGHRLATIRFNRATDGYDDRMRWRSQELRKYDDWLFDVATSDAGLEAAFRAATLKQAKAWSADPKTVLDDPWVGLPVLETVPKPPSTPSTPPLSTPSTPLRPKANFLKELSLPTSGRSALLRAVRKEPSNPKPAPPALLQAIRTSKEADESNTDQSPRTLPLHSTRKPSGPSGQRKARRGL